MLVFNNKMYLKCALMLVMSAISLVNGSILFYSSRKFDMSPLQRFGDEEFTKLLQQLDAPKTIVYKSRLEVLSPQIKRIFDGYYTAFNPNDHVGTENATDIIGDGSTSDLHKIKQNVDNNNNNNNVLYAIVIPTNKRYKRDDEIELSSSTTTTATTTTITSSRTTTITNTPSLELSQSNAINSNSTGPVLYKGKSKKEDTFALLYSSRPLLLKTSSMNSITLGATSPDLITVDTIARDSYSRLNVNIPLQQEGNKITLRFIFGWLNGYWSLNAVKITDTNNLLSFNLTIEQDVTAPVNFSYHCNGMTVFSDAGNSNVSLHLYDMQVQINANVGRFSDAYDCVSFTTAPIWSGLFVTALLGLALVVALVAIGDIKPMDKLDNYKTKQLTITVSE